MERVGLVAKGPVSEPGIGLGQIRGGGILVIAGICISVDLVQGAFEGAFVLIGEDIGLGQLRKLLGALVLKLLDLAQEIRYVLLEEIVDAVGVQECRLRNLGFINGAADLDHHLSRSYEAIVDCLVVKSALARGVLQVLRGRRFDFLGDTLNLLVTVF